MDEDAPSEITVVFEEADGRRTVSATGAFGGPAPNGNSIVANFYVEKPSTPHHIKHGISQVDEGRVSLEEPTGRVMRGEITREIQTTMVMNPKDALEIGQWLVENAKKVLEHQGGESDDGN